MDTFVVACTAAATPGAVAWCWYADAERWETGASAKESIERAGIAAALNLLRATAANTDATRVVTDSRALLDAFGGHGDGPLVERLRCAVEGRDVTVEWAPAAQRTEQLQQARAHAHAAAVERAARSHTARTTGQGPRTGQS